MTTGVLVMAYGTPSGPDEIASFYTDIRRGRPPSPTQLAELERRYAAIGGVSPLAERTAAQLAALAKALEERRPGHFLPAYGAKHSSPKIEQSVAALAASGADAVVGLVLAPHFSELSVGEYVARATPAADEAHLDAAFIERWGANPVLIDLLAERTTAAIAGLGLSASARVEVVVTAHSLPARILDAGDPYADEVAETAALIAKAAGLARVRTAWQSAGRSEEAWLGPDISDLLSQLRAEGADGVVVCPAGFTSDHLEVCYDLDVEARHRAAALGLAFARTASLNDDPRLAAALADLVVAADPNTDRQ